MKTRHVSRWFWPALAAVCLTMPFLTNNAATQSQTPAQKPDVKTAGGLTTVTFHLDHGEITVNLPDDIRAGDTISGTVVEEPKGQTKEERAMNQTELNGLVIEIDGKPVEPPFPVTAKERESTIQKTFWIYHADEARLRPNATDPKTATPKPISISLAKAGSEIAQTTVPIEMVSLSLQSVTPLTVFQLPTVGQQGRPIVVTGPFDGNSSNTILNWIAVRSAVQDFEKNTENVSGGFGLIAESPRKAVFAAPNNVTGPIELHLTEGKTQTTGNYRNLKVDLTAPKTSLLKGESTELHVEVSGLQGLTQPVPLTLESHGVITMVGGNLQSLTIPPSQVGPDGRFTTTRGITGVQTGGWTATATVVTHKFDVCLQDDSAPARRILWNTFNGDYIFICPGCWPPKGQQGSATGTTGESGGTKTGGTTESGGTRTTAGATGAEGSSTDAAGSLSGKGTITMKGCIFTLEHNVTDRRVMSRIDQCTQTGSASVQTVTPKVKFTITDRKTTDNTCSVQ